MAPPKAIAPCTPTVVHANVLSSPDGGGGGGGGVSMHLDVRPALDDVGSVLDRLRMAARGCLG